MSGDWTKPPEFSAEEQKELELEKLILSGNGRDAAMKLVLVALAHAHKERMELSPFFDLAHAGLEFIRHASELELIHFLQRSIKEGKLEPTGLEPFLNLFEFCTAQFVYNKACETQKLAELIPHAKEERSDAS